MGNTLIQTEIMEKFTPKQELISSPNYVFGKYRISETSILGYHKLLSFYRAKCENKKLCQSNLTWFIRGHRSHWGTIWHIFTSHPSNFLHKFRRKSEKSSKLSFNNISAFIKKNMYKRMLSEQTAKRQLIGAGLIMSHKYKSYFNEKINIFIFSFIFWFLLL